MYAAAATKKLQLMQFPMLTAVARYATFLPAATKKPLGRSGETPAEPRQAGDGEETTMNANWGNCTCSETQLDCVGCECVASYSAEEVRRFIINPQRYRGQVERLNGNPRAYGCHVGMRSTRETDMASFLEGWDEIDRALATAEA
jgi:hypothetical protein